MAPLPGGPRGRRLTRIRTARSESDSLRRRRAGTDHLGKLSGVSHPRPDVPVAALNDVLSEVIDGVLDLRQARRRVPETHALHAVLDQLLNDLRAWARLLVDQDQELGVSPLESMSTGAGRTPPHSWHGAASDEEVRRVIGKDLDRLGEHLAVALAVQHDDKLRTALTEVQRGVLVHSRALREL